MQLTRLRPFLFLIAILAFGIIFWSFRLLRNGVEKATQSFRERCQVRDLYACILTSSAESLTFDIMPSDPVAMIIHNSHRYDFSPSGVEDSAALLPSGGHLVHLGSPPIPYTPTLFHQMKCLEIIHAALADAPGSVATPTPLVSHCLNYLRQIILCRPNLRLESVTNGDASSEKEYEVVCKDWEVVYAAAEQNQRAFSALQGY
ncbi:hypothetical protein JVU11DRAFT_10385 [Chiua virens]|nr:hypothetical protein JVU11DRAFT_10385 [Chiua virens]